MDKISLFISNSEIRAARRLVVKILLFTPVLILVVTVNLNVDPAGLYRKMTDKREGYEYHLARSLAEGKDVSLVRPIDDRLLEKYFIEDIAYKPDIVVLGASNAAWVGSNIFPDKRIINNAVSGAVLADYLGIFNGYAGKDKYPQRMIIVLNPQLIIFPFTFDRWVSIKDDTYGMLRRIGIHTKKMEAPAASLTCFNIFSFSYFQKSMQKWWGRCIHPNGTVNKDEIGGQLEFLKDGRCLMAFHYRGPEDSRKKTIKMIYHDPMGKAFRNKMNPDKDLEAILEDFIVYLKAHHIQVTLCLLPFQPEMYKSFLDSRDKPGAMDIEGIEHYYRAVAQRLDLQIVGSYDPASCRLNDSDFYDADHIRNDLIGGVFKQKGSLCFMPGA